MQRRFLQQAFAGPLRAPGSELGNEQMCDHRLPGALSLMRKLRGQPSAATQVRATTKVSRDLQIPESGRGRVEGTAQLGSGGAQPKGWRD